MGSANYHLRSEEDRVGSIMSDVKSKTRDCPKDTKMQIEIDLVIAPTSISQTNWRIFNQVKYLLSQEGYKIELMDVIKQYGQQPGTMIEVERYVLEEV